MLHATIADIIDILVIAVSSLSFSLSTGQLGLVLEGVLRGLTITATPIIPPLWWAGFGEQLVEIGPPMIGSSVEFELLTPASVSFSSYLVPTSFGSVPVPLDISGELTDALDFPPWTGTVVKFAGLCTFLIGVMAWLSSVRYWRRYWGRRIAISGVALTIVGFAFETFIDLLKYVLAG